MIVLFVSIFSSFGEETFGDALDWIAWQSSDMYSGVDEDVFIDSELPK